MAAEPGASGCGTPATARWPTRPPPDSSGCGTRAYCGLGPAMPRRCACSVSATPTASTRPPSTASRSDPRPGSAQRGPPRRLVGARLGAPPLHSSRTGRRSLRPGAGRSPSAAGTAHLDSVVLGPVAPRSSGPQRRRAAMGDGAYLFDPQGDLHTWMTYPSRRTPPINSRAPCRSPTKPRGREGRDRPPAHRLHDRPRRLPPPDPPYTYAFPRDSLLEPGRRDVDRRPPRRSDRGLATQTPWGRTGPILNNSGDKVRLSGFRVPRARCYAYGHAPPVPFAPAHTHRPPPPRRRPRLRGSSPPAWRRGSMSTPRSARPHSARRWRSSTSCARSCRPRPPPRRAAGARGRCSRARGPPSCVSLPRHRLRRVRGDARRRCS